MVFRAESGRSGPTVLAHVVGPRKIRECWGLPAPLGWGVADP